MDAPRFRVLVVDVCVRYWLFILAIDMLYAGQWFLFGAILPIIAVLELLTVTYDQGQGATRAMEYSIEALTKANDTLDVAHTQIRRVMTMSDGERLLNQIAMGVCKDED